MKPPWEAKKDDAKNGKTSGAPWEQGGKSGAKSEEKGKLSILIMYDYTFNPVVISVLKNIYNHLARIV